MLIGPTALVVYRRAAYAPDRRFSRTRGWINMGMWGALDRYKIEVGQYPTAEEGGLTALIQHPPGLAQASTWKGPYARDADDIRDPWGNDLLYQCPGQHHPDGYDLSSAGPDGKHGTADDIANWQSP